MYSVKIKEGLDKKFSKIAKKNPNLIRMLDKKISEILENPQRYKNLKAPLNKWKRVHVDKHFVLTFSVDENSKTIILEDYDHHDKIYKN